ncbi:MAG TPA: hypothetical protein VH054_03160 [Polyangiaceae bacterium]|nr:hypothetical protein [Polyangiaceae bacterium]
MSFAGVVPASIVLGLQACSSGPVLGVAAVAMCCFEASMPDADASDAKTEASDAPEDSPSDVTSDVIGDAPEGG